MSSRANDSDTAGEMEALVEEYAKQLEEIGEILEKRKTEISQKESILKEIEETLKVAEKEMEKKGREINEKDDQIKKMETLIKQKKEDLAIQEEELQTSAALQYLSYSMRDEELNGKMDELSVVEKRGVDPAKMAEIEKRLTEQNKEIEELEKRLMVEGQSKGGAPIAAGGPPSAEVLAQLDGLKEKLRAKEQEIAKKEEEYLDFKRSVEKMATQDEKGQARMKILRDMETKIKERDKQIKDKEEELEGFKAVLGDIEVKLNQKEAELKIREDELNLKSSNIERSMKLSPKDMAKMSNLEEEVRYRVEAELDVRLKAAEHKYEARVAPLVKKIETLSKRNDELETVSERIESDKSALEMREMELKDRLAEIAYNEQKIAKRQDMMLKDRLRLEEEINKYKNAAKVSQAAGGVAVDDEVLAKTQALQDLETKLKEREEFLRRKEQEIRNQQSATIESDLAMEMAVDKEKTQDKCKTGIMRLDDLLYGGYPFKSNVMIFGPTFTGKLVMINLFIAEGLRKGIPGLYVLTDKTPAEIRESLKPILRNVESYESQGLLKYVDAYSKGMGIEEDDPYTIFINKVTDLDDISLAIADIQKKWAEKFEYHKVALHTLSTVMAYVDVMQTYKFMQALTARSKRAKAVALYVVDSSGKAKDDIQSLKHVMSGSIEFKIEDQRHSLRVEGIGDVRTRAGVEYVHTSKSIDIRGAFSVDHIR